MTLIPYLAALAVFIFFAFFIRRLEARDLKRREIIEQHSAKALIALVSRPEKDLVGKEE